MTILLLDLLITAKTPLGILRNFIITNSHRSGIPVLHNRYHIAVPEVHDNAEGKGQESKIARSNIHILLCIIVLITYTFCMGC